MGMSGISKSQVSRLCEEIDERVGAFLSRPLEGDWPYIWIDANLHQSTRERACGVGGRHRRGRRQAARRGRLTTRPIPAGVHEHLALLHHGPGHDPAG